VRIFNLYVPDDVELEIRGYGLWSDEPELWLLPDLISWRPSGKNGGFTTTQELMTFTKGANQNHRYFAVQQLAHLG
jgi:hypothetical protein